jgi:hypothetical protein
MSKTANKPGAFFLAEYTGIIDEVELNWGSKGGYFEEEKIPVLFIFSNFPHTVSTNRQSLVGSIRTHVEEKKGIIFFPDAMKEEVRQFVHEALKKEKVELDFYPFSGKKYNPGYLSQICDTCFSIKNINIQEVIKMATPTIHQEMIKRLGDIEDKEVTCFIFDNDEKEIVDSLHLDQKPSSKRKASFQDIVKDKVFKSRFFDLFLGEESVPDRIKRFYEGKGWKFDSLLIFYSSRKKRAFIQNLPETALFLNANETTFFSLNTEYNLLKFDYNTQPDQRITITMNNMAQRFDVLLDGKTTENPELKRDIMTTFPGSSESINEFLSMITHNTPNEFRFYFDRMAVFVKIVGNKYTIENHEAR